MEQTVVSDRVLYTPSEFAKNSLIYLQEVGQSKTIKKHTNSRNKLDSFLFFIVTEGNGTLTYNNSNYDLTKNSCVILDCSSNYSHTSDNWSIKWIHFNGNNVKSIYKKYLSRNGSNIFNSKHFSDYQILIENIQNEAKSSNYIKDINIYNKLTTLLSLLMSETIYENKDNSKTVYNIESIKTYIDNNYLNDISLDSLSRTFYINKYYLTRLFKSTYGITINNYITNKKIVKSKELLRFTNLSVSSISSECSIKDVNYYIRLFKKVEGITPKKYREQWQQ